MVRILITIITIMVLVKTRKSPFVTSVYDASVYDATNDASVYDESYGRGITGYLCGSRGLSARRVRRTKSRGPKGLQLEVVARRATRLLYTILEYIGIG